MNVQPVSPYSPDSEASYFCDLLAARPVPLGGVGAMSNALREHGKQMFGRLPVTEQNRLVASTYIEQAEKFCAHMPPKYLWDGWHCSTGYAGSVSAICARHKFFGQQLPLSAQDFEVLRWDNSNGTAQGWLSKLEHVGINAELSVKASGWAMEETALGAGSITDQSIFEALMSGYVNQLNAAIICELLGAATEQTTILISSRDGNSNNVHDQILNMSDLITDTTNQRPDAVIMSPRRWRWLLANSRLRSDRMLKPSEITAQPPVPYPAGWAGPQKLPVYVDANMFTKLGHPTEDGEDQIIVTCRQDMRLFQRPYLLKFNFKNG